MKKPFCDICDKPAVAISSLSAQVAMPERTWIGYQTGSSGSGSDGRWVPSVWVHSNFKGINLSKDDYRERTPELCAACIIFLVEKQLAELKERLK